MAFALAQAGFPSCSFLIYRLSLWITPYFICSSLRKGPLSTPVLTATVQNAFHHVWMKGACKYNSWLSPQEYAQARAFCLLAACVLFEGKLCELYTLLPYMTDVIYLYLYSGMQLWGKVHWKSVIQRLQEHNTLWNEVYWSTFVLFKSGPGNQWPISA